MALPPDRAGGASRRATGAHLAGAWARARRASPRIDVTIDLIQPTGSRTYATFLLASTEVMAELQAHDVERPGERLQLYVDMNRAVLIDPQTELVL